MSYAGDKRYFCAGYGCARVGCLEGVVARCLGRVDSLVSLLGDTVDWVRPTTQLVTYSDQMVPLACCSTLAPFEDRARAYQRKALETNKRLLI